MLSLSLPISFDNKLFSLIVSCLSFIFNARGIILVGSFMNWLDMRILVSKYLDKEIKHAVQR